MLSFLGGPPQTPPKRCRDTRTCGTHVGPTVRAFEYCRVILSVELVEKPIASGTCFARTSRKYGPLRYVPGGTRFTFRRAVRTYSEVRLKNPSDLRGYVRTYQLASTGTFGGERLPGRLVLVSCFPDPSYVQVVVCPSGFPFPRVFVRIHSTRFASIHAGFPKTSDGQKKVHTAHQKAHTARRTSA